MPDESFASGKKHPDIEKAAELYAEHRDERIAAGKLESEAHEALLKKMAEHGCQEYRFPDENLVVKVKQGKHKVSVKTVKEAKEGEDDDEDGEDDEEEEGL